MATDRIFVDYVAEQLGLGARLTHRKMFGEYALYLDGKVVAFACDNSLFIKPNAAVARLAPELPQRPPYPEAKDYPVADELLDDGGALRRVFIESAALLPAPKPKTKPKPRPKPKAAKAPKAAGRKIGADTAGSGKPAVKKSAAKKSATNKSLAKTPAKKPSRAG